MSLHIGRGAGVIRTRRSVASRASLRLLLASAVLAASSATSVSGQEPASTTRHIPATVAADAPIQVGGWSGEAHSRIVDERYPGGRRLDRDVEQMDVTDLVFRRVPVPPQEDGTQAAWAVSGTFVYRFRSDLAINGEGCVATGGAEGRVRFVEERPDPSDAEKRLSKGIVGLRRIDGGWYYYLHAAHPVIVGLTGRCTGASAGRVPPRSHPATEFLVSDWAEEEPHAPWVRLTDPTHLVGEGFVDRRYPTGGEFSRRWRWDLRATSAVAADILALPALDKPDELDVVLRIANRGSSTVTRLRPPTTLDLDGQGVATLIAGPAPSTLGELPPGRTAVFGYRYRTSRRGPISFKGQAEVHDQVVDGTFPVVATGGLSLVVNVGTDAGLPVATEVCDVDADVDGDQCSLRAAIELANVLPGRDAIVFDPLITSVRPRRPLPEITSPLSLDGTLAGGGRVELDGRDAGQAHGLVVTGGGTFITGLVIHSFEGSGVVLRGSGGSSVTGSVIGLTRDGRCPRFDIDQRVCRGNGAHGVHVDGSDANTIGGLLTTQRCQDPCNVISGNAASGVAISGTGGSADSAPGGTGRDNRILGNIIGLDPSGGCVDRSPRDGCLVGNGHDGVLIDAADATVVGGTVSEPWTCSGPCNLIGANRLHGIAITGPRSTAAATQVLGNWIGIDAEGRCLAAAGGGCRTGNLGSGIVVAGGLSDDLRTNDTVVGGRSAGQGNVIAGNGHAGVRIVGDPNGDVQVLGNRIGTGPDGRSAYPNAVGVLVDSAATSLGTVTVRGSPPGTKVVGGEPAGDAVCTGGCNLVSGNTGAGVSVRDLARESSVTLVGNVIGLDAEGSRALGNGGHGIEGVRAGMLRIGGDPAAPGAWTTVSGNGGTGIRIEDSHFGSIVHARVGTDSDGAAAIPNRQHGIWVARSLVSVGHASGCDPACNVVSGNVGFGIVLEGVKGALRDGPSLFHVCICGNRVGTDTSGMAPLGNSRVGIVISDSESIDVGSPRAANVVSANLQSGIALDLTTDVLLRNNKIGTTVEGTCLLERDGRCPLGNRYEGMFIRDSIGAVIGGPGEADGNVVAGNAYKQVLAAGIAVVGRQSRSVTIVGNRVGVGVGRMVVPNGGGGITIADGRDTVIGGDRRALGNIIAGNGPDCRCPGIQVTRTAQGTLVMGNRIGVLADDDETAVPNGGHGILVRLGATGTVIGGETAGQGNVIAHNGIRTGYDGIRILRDAGAGNEIRGNRIRDNLGLGIDTGRDGVASDDPDTIDSRQTSRPVLIAAKGGVLDGEVAGPPRVDVRIDLYSNDACDGGVFGSGEGQRPAGSVTVRLGGNGRATFQAQMRKGNVFTATATVDGTTSEFSRCIERGAVVDTTDVDGDGVTDVVEDGAGSRGDGNGDGVPDRHQPDIASMPSAVDGRFLTLAAPPGGRLQGVHALDLPDPEGAPADVSFPAGFVSFQVSVEPGTTVTMVLRLPAGSDIEGLWAWHDTAPGVVSPGGGPGVTTETASDTATDTASYTAVSDGEVALEPSAGAAPGWVELSEVTAAADVLTVSIRDGSSDDPDGTADGFVRLVFGAAAPSDP